MSDSPPVPDAPGETEPSADTLAALEARTARIEAALAAVERAVRADAESRDARVIDGLAVLLGTAFADLVATVDRRIAHAIAAVGDGWPPPDPAAVPSAPAPAAEPVVAPRPAAPAPPLGTVPLVVHDFAEDWARWRPKAAATPHPGVVELGAPAVDAGPDIAGPSVPLLGGGLVRVTVEARLPAGPRLWQPFLRLTADDGTRLGADVPLADGTTEAFFFAPACTKGVAAALLTPEPVAGQRYTLRRILLDRVHPESYFAHVRAGAAAPTIAALTSTPPGRASLPDAVASLLLGCDRVRVYLEGYPDVPECLIHPRVDYRRSQDWDERGDAGAFAWADQDDPPGYRIAAADWLIYPPDFARTMARRLAAYGDRAILGLGGALLRQPATPRPRRGTQALAPDVALAEDRTVHVLDPAALAYHSGAVRLDPGEFAYRGLAGLWIARQAKRRHVPLIAAARPGGWVRRHPHAAKDPAGGPSAARVAAVAAATLKQMAPLTMQPSGRPKVALVVAVSSINDLAGFLGGWEAIRPRATDWVLVLSAEARMIPGVHAVLDDLGLFHEIHLTSALAEAAALVGRLGCDAVLVTTDDLRFKSRGTLGGLIEMLGRAPDSVLVVPAPPPEAGARAGCPPLVAFGRNAARQLPPDDAALPPHLRFADWTARAGAAGRMLGQATGDALLARYGAAPGPDDLAEWRAANPAAAAPPPAPPPAPRVRPRSINAFFERVVVLNLDRRAERWGAARARLARAGVTASRFRAVDPTWPETLSDYIAYAGGAPTAPPPGLRSIGSPLAFYKDYDSQTARVGHLEARDSRKAIASPAAWAALQSHIAVIERAMRDGVASLLVLSDNVVLHRDAAALFAAAVAELPEDWLILQLGTPNARFGPAWAEWRTPHLYSAGGAAVGTYALGIRDEAYAPLLDHARRGRLPFDIGALSAVTRAFADRCFVVSPHLAIVAAEDGGPAAALGGTELSGYDFGGRGTLDPGEPFAR